MGFFDDLVPREEPAAERPVLARLTPPPADDGRYGPPVDRFAPVLLSALDVVGAGPETRVLLTGWSVWPRSLTLHLAVFRRTRRAGPATRRQSGLRVGLRFSDGRRVTSLDGTEPRRMTGPRGAAGPAVSAGAVGLVPLDPGQHLSRGSLFTTDVDLYLAELPPPGEAWLVVEWPDEGIPETHTAIGVAALRAASGRAIEVWPDLEPPEPTAGRRLLATLEVGGPPAFLAPPLTSGQQRRLADEEEARQRYVPRADWQGMAYRSWEDTALVRARLAGGAPPGATLDPRGATPLHRVAERGAAEAVGLLLAHGAEVDARDGDGHTPLWHAVRALDEGTLRALIEAGADVWTPQTGPWSPGRLLATTSLAPLVTGLPGAVESPAEEVAAFRAAGALIAAFGREPLWTEGLGVAFVRGLGEDEVIRRLGGDPARCPMTDREHLPFDSGDYDAALRHVAVRGVSGDPGGCVVSQQGYLPSQSTVLEALSTDTTAYGVYFNPKGGVFGTLAGDGAAAAHEEIGLLPHRSAPDAHWHFRFWQRGRALPYRANVLAYACAAAGLRITEGREAVDLRTPRRWVALPARLR
ncbi:ankyrin repeat domain-containing protein [Streptomyces hainanensis]|uniref:Ankyrin repeat domain-containing protein n=1 Tax=Streptomyces hainanensis TaxID=402648 RepID=A0A4R4T5P6_9ACTN|nr:ankyrin repeat domain-containing protein [Streptomyces hainanensis]TDC72368.1 ankyrin repeat domain-containing protein [Streptomyces hainanensis]